MTFDELMESAERNSVLNTILISRFGTTSPRLSDDYDYPSLDGYRDSMAGGRHDELAAREEDDE